VKYAPHRVVVKTAGLYLRAGSLLFLLLASTAALAGEPEVTDVFVAGRDGFTSIRIPSVVVSKRGTALAFAEGRAANADQARNRIVLKRSTDGGKTFGKIAVIAEDGDRALNNPCVVVERASGLVLLMYQSYPAGIGERSGKLQPGYDGERVVRNYLITSADDGVTWSKPRDLTRETKRAETVTTIASGPGIGIQLRHGKYAGRLLFPFNEGPFGLWNIYAVYSDDQGKTWAMGEVAPGGLIDAPKGGKVSTVNEAQLVELKDGSTRFNVRRWGGKPVRKTCLSKDGGITWSKVEDAPDLRDSGCMASVFRYTDPADGEKSRILFSGPQSTQRANGTVFLSDDEGLTWPVQRVLNQDSFAYSCLTALPDGTLGCLYEADGTKRIVFARFTLDWLTDGKDHLEQWEWKPLPPLPDKEGFAGPFAGVSHGVLLVAGGANFPAKKPWEGGIKVWYDTIFALDRPDGRWSVVGKLPRPLGYGISVTHRDSVVCVGGSDADRHYAEAFRLEYTAGKVVATPLHSLPRPVANACGALAGDMLYVAGGQEKPDATDTLKTVYRIDLAAEQPAWREVEPWPGGGRMLAVAASFDGAFWIAGGTDLVAGKDGKAERRYLKDAYRYDPDRGWKRIADLPRPAVAAPSPAPADGSGFFILGGDDGANVGFTPPERHPGFERSILRFDGKTASWTEAGPLPAPRVTAPVVRWNNLWVVPSGELRPGVRSPEVWSFSNR